MSSRTGRPTASEIMRSLGLVPDPWQVEVLEAAHPRLLLNRTRQSGKSTVVAVLALAEAVCAPGTKALLLSRSHRQSAELFRIVTGFYRRLKSPLLKRQTQHELELEDFSRVVCLPCREDTIRGYADIDLLVLDEAARVPDDLYRAVRPMLAVSKGRMICLSTPYDKRGFFHDCWARGGADWHRIEVPAEQVGRISREFLAQERRATACGRGSRRWQRGWRTGGCGWWRGGARTCWRRRGCTATATRGGGDGGGAGGRAQPRARGAALPDQRAGLAEDGAAAARQGAGGGGDGGGAAGGAVVAAGGRGAVDEAGVSVLWGAAIHRRSRSFLLVAERKGKKERGRRAAIQRIAWKLRGREGRGSA